MAEKTISHTVRLTYDIDQLLGLLRQFDNDLDDVMTPIKGATVRAAFSSVSFRTIEIRVTQSEVNE